MLCQGCHAVEATHRVTERSASGGFVELHYCEGCCKALAGLPDKPPAGLYTLVDRQSGQSRVVTLDEVMKRFLPPTDPYWPFDDSPLTLDRQDMTTSPGQTCQTCFTVLLATGLVFLFIGLLVVPILPYHQVDAVLTPEELLDQHKHDAALALLKKAAGNQWLFWTAAGLVVTVTSTVGLCTVRKAEWQRE